MDVWLTHLLETLAGIGAWRYAVAFIGMFFETTLFVGLLIPGDTIVLFTATAGRGAGEWLLLLAAVLVGSLSGESVGYWLGSRFGPAIRRSRLGRRIGEAQWLRSERWIEHRGGTAVFISRFLPVFHALVPVTVGATGFGYRRFISWSAPACLLWAAIYVSVGTAAGSSYRVLSRELHFAGWLILGGLVVFALVVTVVRRLLQRVARRQHEG